MAQVERARIRTRLLAFLNWVHFKTCLFCNMQMWVIRKVLRNSQILPPTTLCVSFLDRSIKNCDCFKMLEKLLLMTGFTTPLCNTDEVNCWENRPFTTIWPDNQQKLTKGTEVKKTIKKKPKRIRTAFTTEQIKNLEKVFSSTRYIDKEKRNELASSLKMNDKCIKIWFQNRRMKEKRNSESSCDTSIESYSTDASPPTNVQIQIDVKVKEEEQVESSTIMYTTQADTYNADEYQVPNFYHENYNQYWGGSNNIPPNNTFYYDTNVYPTQYYPNSGYYTEECVQPQYWASDINHVNYY